MVSFKEISDLHNSFEIEGQCRDHRSSPSPRDAAGTGPAAFKTTLLRKTVYLQSSLVKCCVGYYFI